MERGLCHWDKAKSQSLLRTAGLQLPGILPADGFIHSIYETRLAVNQSMALQIDNTASVLYIVDRLDRKSLALAYCE